MKSGVSASNIGICLTLPETSELFSELIAPFYTPASTGSSMDMRWDESLEDRSTLEQIVRETSQEPLARKPCHRGWGYFRVSGDKEQDRDSEWPPR